MSLIYIARFTYTQDSKCFFPKIYDEDTAQPSNRTVVLVFRLMFAFVLFFRLIKLLCVDIYKIVKTFFQTHKLDVSFSFVFYTGVLVLVTFVLVLSFVYNLRMKYSEISMSNF